MTAGTTARVAAFLSDFENNLSDDQLKHAFPDKDPQRLRHCLQSAADILVQINRNIAREKELMPQSKPETDILTVLTDGASRGNPGEAGAGFQILDASGREISGQGFYLGQCTNNVAEYQALLYGLAEAQNLGGREITVKLDSELIVKQINGQYKVKDLKLKPLFAKAIDLLSKFRSYRVLHIPRAQNHRADQLANEGIDGRRTL